ncbi:steroid 17-alpha-hydroxylase/17,20 lyase-like isoform X2 [Acanthaster planci]|nr:steroid 17-alpha-hydroxylase/17,20 lyase-like isoform X2 [Acanthaster planci]XP_022081148.1 steroid 17-alpha-hydroxylase/17,20 lyase-like isoform X2 [Acanthaster planci]
MLESAAEFKKKYGPIVSLKMGTSNVVLLNNIEVVKEALIKKGLDFVGRPSIHSVSLITEGYKDIAFTDYGPQWRYQRKLGHTAIRHFAQKEHLEKLVFTVIPGIAKILDDLGDKSFAPKWTVGQIVFNILSTLCFAKQYEFNQPELMEWISINQELSGVASTGLPSDILPIFRYLPTPKDRKFGRVLKQYHAMYYKELQKHRESFDTENIHDFFDSLLLTQKENIEAGEEGADRLTDTHLVQTVADIFGAGTETTILTLHWAVLLMAEHPDIQEKVAMEIDEVIGRNRMPSLDDRGSVPFTEATIWEIFRFGSAVPFGVPHTAMTDSKLHGYRITKGTLVMINHFALHYDPDVWTEPKKFKPERFLNDNGQLPAKPPENLLPFGCGRRVCLGEDFAKKEIFLLFTWLCSRYTFYKVPGNMSESLLKLNRALGFAHQPLDDAEVCVKKRF